MRDCTSGGLGRSLTTAVRQLVHIVPAWMTRRFPAAGLRLQRPVGHLPRPVVTSVDLPPYRSPGSQEQVSNWAWCLCCCIPCLLPTQTSPSSRHPTRSGLCLPSVWDFPCRRRVPASVESWVRNRPAGATRPSGGLSPTGATPWVRLPTASTQSSGWLLSRMLRADPSSCCRNSKSPRAGPL